MVDLLAEIKELKARVERLEQDDRPLTRTELARLRDRITAWLLNG